MPTLEQRKEETLNKLKEEKAKLQAAAKDAQAKSDELHEKEALTNDTKSTMTKVTISLCLLESVKHRVNFISFWMLVGRVGLLRQHLRTLNTSRECECIILNADKVQLAVHSRLCHACGGLLHVGDYERCARWLVGEDPRGADSHLRLLQVQEQVKAKQDELARKKAEWEKAQRDLEPLKV